jgi:VCBS repeat-containing protein
MSLNIARRHRRPRSRTAIGTPEILEPRSLLNGAWGGLAENAQHTALSPVAAQPLDTIHWQTPVDLNPQYSGSDLFIHYGSMSITSAGTIVLPVKTGATNGFEVQGLTESDGSLLWTIASDYVLPPHGWIPSFSPALTSSGALDMPALGGLVDQINNPDSKSASINSKLAFFGINNYNANPTAYDNNVMIDTPITADSAGNIYFGFVVTGATPLGLQSGIARIDANGQGTYVAATTAAGSAAVDEVVQNCAPAVSNDGKTVYIAVSTGNFSSGYLLALDSTTLATVGKAALIDPKSGQSAALPNDGSASPVVGPDGDVYFGVLENPFPSNNDRGWLLHFNANLTQTKTPGAFGWDDTPSIVPSSMIAGYQGTSSYLMMTKYNNYRGIGTGDGVNRIAIVDPNASQTDPISGATTMAVVRSIVGATPDSPDPSFPYAVREWCINTAAVDPATDSIMANSEDGKIYRWDLATNTFSQVVTLTAGIGEAYTPTVIGPDGTVFAINNATLFAVGAFLPPVASDDSYSVNENNTLLVASPGVLANDTDGSAGLALSPVIVSSPAHGKLSLNADGSFTYTPDALYSGPDSFTYRAFDGSAASGIATVSLAINPVPIANPDAYSVAEDGSLIVPAAGVLANDTDAKPNTTLTAVVVSQPAHGALTLSQSGGFTYTPTALYRGPDSFTYQASDAGLKSATTTVSLTVTPVNHAPVAVANNYSTPEDSTLTIFAQNGVLANDTVVDPGVTLTATLITPPTNGTLTLNLDGSFQYTPAALYRGADQFTYVANNGALASNAATVSLTVTPVAHKPTTNPDSYTTLEDQPLVVDSPGVLANDTVVDPNTTPSAVLMSPPTHGDLTFHADGSFTYRPSALYRGPDSFTYQASDSAGAGNVATVSLTVSPVNHPPTAAPDSYVATEDAPLYVFAPEGVLANDTSIDPGAILTAKRISGPSHGTLDLNADGSFRYSPDPLYTGPDAFTYAAAEGQLDGDTVAVAIDVTPVNHLPIATGSFIAAVQASGAGASVATFTDVDNEPPSQFNATIDWGDGTSATPGNVTAINGVYNVSGSHVYDVPGGYFTTVTIEDPGGGSVVAVGRVSVAAVGVVLAGAPIAGSDSGASSTDRISNIASPTVAGTAPAGYLVQLFAQAGTTIALIGQGTADSSNAYQITASPLLDGTYNLLLVATNPSAPGSHFSLSATAGWWTVDTQSARMTSASITPRNGRVVMSFQDFGAGLDTSTLLNASLYSVQQFVNHHLVTVPISRIESVGVAPPLGVRTVAIVLKNGRRLARGSYVVRVASALARDLAGNTLDGEYAGAFPSGDGHPGGDFAAQFNVNSQRVVTPAPSLAALGKAGSLVHSRSVSHLRKRRS